MGWRKTQKSQLEKQKTKLKMFYIDEIKTKKCMTVFNL